MAISWYPGFSPIGNNDVNLLGESTMRYLYKADPRFTELSIPILAVLTKNILKWTFMSLN